MQINSTHNGYKDNNMHELYDWTAPKKAANPSANGSLLAETRSLKVNFSATFEKAL